MQDLTYRQEKIQQKRKQTSFRDFVREICSWWSLNFYRNTGHTSVFPQTERTGNIVWLKEYYANYDNILHSEIQQGSTFFESFQTLFRTHHKPNLYQVGTNENSDYSNICVGTKNAYLSFVPGVNSENILYSTQARGNVRNIINSSLVVDNSENIFHSKMITNSFNIFYSQHIYNCSDMRFCSNCVGCHFCMECDNLENASYCIKNQQYTKEEFNRLKNSYLPRNYYDLRTQTFSHKGINVASSEVSGNGLYQCHKVENGYNILNYTDSRNIIFSAGTPLGTHHYDCIEVGDNSDNLYAICSWGTNSHHCYLCHFVSTGCFNVFYSIHLENCSFCLWCIGLKNKQFCIFNKQYTKEERYAKVDEIFTQMEQDWTLWQFFPPTMNPFYFNDTAAYLIDPSFTKEEVEKAWYLRRDEPIKVDIPANAELVKTSELNNYEGFNSEGKWTINDEILKKVIVDENGNMWRIVNMEYAFLVKYGLPLPRKHRLERMKENFKIG